MKHPPSCWGKRGTPKSLGSGHPPSDARRLSLGTPEKRGLCQMIKQLLSQLAGCKGLAIFSACLGFLPFIDTPTSNRTFFRQNIPIVQKSSKREDFCIGPRTKRSDDGPAMYRGPISFVAGARPLRKSRSSEGQLVEIQVNWSVRARLPNLYPLNWPGSRPPISINWSRTMWSEKKTVGRPALQHPTTLSTGRVRLRRF
jgi:hypothetical protein